MQLRFSAAYKSIVEFPTLDVPDLLVVTGLNGSGKTQLLEAIENSAIEIAGLIDGRGGQPIPWVRRFSLGEFKLAPDIAANAAASHEHLVSQFVEAQKLAASRFGNEPQSADQRSVEIAEELLRSQALTRTALSFIEASTDVDLASLSPVEFVNLAPPVIGLQHAFGLATTEVFLSYFRHRQANRFREFLSNDGRAAPNSFLTETEYERRFGPPPWELLTEMLQRCGLPYEFEVPDDLAPDDRSFRASLISQESNRTVSIDSLSTGEQTILSTALALYAAESAVDQIAMPQVLLLDEVDATLHPSLVRKFLDVLQSTLVGRLGVKVVVVTHSPTTVALAPDDSIFLMTRQPINGHRLTKSSKDECLKRLSAGLPTLSVRMENRRQVFVESKDDEAAYTELFKILRTRVESPFSLEFIATGKTRNGGKDSVKRLVTELQSRGNQSVRGIIDWDGVESETELIFVNSERYTLENFLLDPAAIACFLLRTGGARAGDMGLEDDVRYSSIDTRHAQSLATWLADSALDSPGSTSVQAVSYVAGHTLWIPTEYLFMNGHDLEGLLLDKIPPLRQTRGSLKAEILRLHYTEHPGWIPQSVLDLFTRICQ